MVQSHLRSEELDDHDDNMWKFKSEILRSQNTRSINVSRRQMAHLDLTQTLQTILAVNRGQI